jgi:hypothetical protein
MRILGAAVLAVVLAACGGHRNSAPPVTGPSERALADSARQITAAPVSPDPRVGAIFLDGDNLHFCTGAVLHSTGGDLVLTAAHCLGPGLDAAFVPGFAREASPADFWTMGAAYLDPRWLAQHDPRADYAIVRVSRPEGGSVEAYVGSALTLGAAPAPGNRVTVVAYPAGVGGMPVGCTTGTTIAGGYPKFPCGGLAAGTSGGPWIIGSSVTGVIGGLHNGGCAENVSYTAPFDQHITELLARAEAGGPGDVPPDAFDDGC